MREKTRLDYWCEAGIEAGWLAALVVAPLFFNVYSSRVFEPDKISILRTIALVMLLAWLVKVANGGSLWQPAFGGVDRIGNQRPVLAQLIHTPFLLPVLLLVLAYALSTWFSVARFVSWWGSYQRLQGTYTFLSYVIISLLTMAHLRRPAQIRRLQHAIIISSIPIAIYGIIQHFGIDPLPWGGDTQRRIAANAGNAIFLAAYLIMAVFLTIERIYSSFAYLLRNDEDLGEGDSLATVLAGGSYLFVLMVQLLAIVWTQSRGPWLGLFLGLYIFVLLTLSALRPRNFLPLLTAWVGLGLIGVATIVLMNTTPLFDSFQSVPYAGRLTRLLDQSSKTAQVRIWIWEGTSDLVAPHEPLMFPDGSTDRANFIRPLVGYGPEAMWVAYNPFYPPELANVEKRNASPDRSHNETWDSLVITGVLGFIAYIGLFLAIFYWVLRWLGLLINRRDRLLFFTLLSVFAIGLSIAFYQFDGSWRYFGVSLPAGIEAGLVIYIMLAPFLHPHHKVDAADLPRQLLIIAILSTISAHFVEIHFGIAIAATRTYFWIEMALLLVLGMRWAAPEAFARHIETEQKTDDRSARAATQTPAPHRRGRSARQAPVAPRWLSPTTIMSDILVFLTFVFIYTTNSSGNTAGAEIFFDSILTRTVRGETIFSPSLLYLMFFTWLIAVTVGLASTVLQRRQPVPLGWWLRGYAVHALIVWGVWLIYGLYHARRTVPGISGNDLDSQLNQVAGHFAIYSWIVVLWLLGTATVLAWPHLRERRRPFVGRSLVGGGVAILAAITMFYVVSTVNIALVKADIIYKQGQQFDSARNWLSSVELYRRALASRRTEDHYMLFLGRSLLEQAKQSDLEGLIRFPATPTLDDVLAMTPQDVNNMSRQDLLRAAETVLRQAQVVNPLNTDHTANLARLYRSWADLSDGDEALQQTMLDKSIEQYEIAVQLSPNAAHLWNEKGNAHLARRERDLAEAAYLRSHQLDPRFLQTYLLLADFYEKQEDHARVVSFLTEGIEYLQTFDIRSPQMYSFLSVAQARTGDLAGAIESNRVILEIDPDNLSAIRNLAILYRDIGDWENSARWTEQAIERTDPENRGEIRTLRELLVENLRSLNDGDGIVRQYELILQNNPQDTQILPQLGELYRGQGELERSFEVYRQLSTLLPTDYRWPLAIAELLAELGDVENAVRFAERALQSAPEEQRPAISRFLSELTTETNQ